MEDVICKEDKEIGQRLESHNTMKKVENMFKEGYGFSLGFVALRFLHSYMPLIRSY
jgi:hypothetical protein